MKWLSAISVAIVLLTVADAKSLNKGPAEKPKESVDLTAAAKVPDEAETRVVGGNPPPDHVPWLVSIQSTGGHLCAGTLIGTKQLPYGNTMWIVTAAQCVKGISAHLLTVRYGSDKYYTDTDTDTEENVAEVDYTVVHDNFSAPLQLNDIALIKLKQQIPIGGTWAQGIGFSDVQDSFEASNTPLVFVGWGFTKDQPEDYPGNRPTDNRKRIDIRQLPFTNCTAEYAHRGVALNGPTSQLCAGQVEGGEGFCQGDIGGGLYVPALNILEGIASFSIGCGQKQFPPGVYTRLSHYINWIYAVTKMPPGYFDWFPIKDAETLAKK